MSDRPFEQAAKAFDPIVKQLNDDCQANPTLVLYGQFYVSDTIHDRLQAIILDIVQRNLRYNPKPTSPNTYGVPWLDDTFLKCLSNLTYSPLRLSDIQKFLDGYEVKDDLAAIRALFPSTAPGNKEVNAVQHAYWYIWNSPDISTTLPPTMQWTYGINGPLMDAAWSYERTRCYSTTNAFVRKLLKKRGVTALPQTARISQGLIAGAAITGPRSDTSKSPLVAPQTVTYGSATMLASAVSLIESALDAGGLVVLGVVSGVSQDKALWGTPEHYLLALGHATINGADWILFWDPDHGSTEIKAEFGSNWGKNIGCLVNLPNHLSTGLDQYDFGDIDVDSRHQNTIPPTFGYHKEYGRRHRYQVFYAQSKPQ
jgi:hypothetical protein